MRFSIVLLLVVIPGICEATTFIVHSDATGDTATIQDALDSAADGDTILLTPGTFRGSGNRDLRFGTISVVLTSAGGPDVTILDCENAWGFSFSGGQGPECEISGLTFLSTTRMRVNASAPTLRGNIFRDGRALASAGVLEIFSASPTIVDNRFEGHTGGSSVHAMSSNPRLERNQFLSSGTSISIAMEYCGGEILDNTFSYTSLALLLDHSSPDVVGNLFVHGGRVMSLVQGSPFIRFNTLHDNRFGLLFDDLSSPFVSNNIIASTTQGPAIDCSPASQATITWLLLFDNQGETSCALGESYVADPLLCEAEDGVYSLQQGSPGAPGNNASGQTIGAFPVGCQTVAIKQTSWSQVKRLYRR